MSAPLWDAATAMRWLRAQRDDPDMDYTDWCALIVARSAGYDAAGYKDASTWGRAVQRYAIPWAKVRRGDVLAWITQGWGHIARYAGYFSGHHYVLCNNADGGISLIRVDHYDDLGTPIVLGGDDPRVFAGCRGRNPGKKPAPKPRPAPSPLPAQLPVIHWALVQKAFKTDGSAKAISWVKSALAAEGFDCGNRTDHAGPGLRRAWGDFQVANGWKRTGIAGNRGLTLLGARHGRRVVR